MKNFFLPLWQITFDLLKNGLKKYSSMEQNLVFFFIRNLRALHLLFAGTYIRIWGHLYSAGIALQLYFALRFERLKRVQKSRAIPWDFWEEVFSLSMPSVCPHLTTVWFEEQGTFEELLNKDCKLMLNESKLFQRSSRISFVPFRTFRGPLFPKPLTGQELFLANNHCPQKAFLTRT